MRVLLALVFVALFVGSLACGIVLGGPPSSVYEYGDLLIGVAGSLLFMSLLVLIALVFGIGSTGVKRSVWRLPLLCLVAAFLSLVFGLAILGSKMEDLTPQHAALNLRLKIFAGVLVLYALFLALSALVSYLMAKHHNSKLPPG